MRYRVHVERHSSGPLLRAQQRARVPKMLSILVAIALFSWFVMTMWSRKRPAPISHSLVNSHHHRAFRRQDVQDVQITTMPKIIHNTSEIGLAGYAQRQHQCDQYFLATGVNVTATSNNVSLDAELLKHILKNMCLSAVSMNQSDEAMYHNTELRNAVLHGGLLARLSLHMTTSQEVLNKLFVRASLLPEKRVNDHSIFQVIVQRNGDWNASASRRYIVSEAPRIDPVPFGKRGNFDILYWPSSFSFLVEVKQTLLKLGPTDCLSMTTLHLVQRAAAMVASRGAALPICTDGSEPHDSTHKQTRTPNATLASVDDSLLVLLRGGSSVSLEDSSLFIYSLMLSIFEQRTGSSSVGVLLSVVPLKPGDIHINISLSIENTSTTCPSDTSFPAQHQNNKDMFVKNLSGVVKLLVETSQHPRTAVLEVEAHLVNGANRDLLLHVLWFVDRQRSRVYDLWSSAPGQQTVSSKLVQYAEDVSEGMARMLTSGYNSWQRVLVVSTLDPFTLTFLCVAGVWIEKSTAEMVVGIVPGPRVPQFERHRVEKHLGACLPTGSSSTVIITWLRPDEDTIDTPYAGPHGLYDPKMQLKMNSWWIDVPRTPLGAPHFSTLASVVRIPMKDIREFTIQLLLSFSAPPSFLAPGVEQQAGQAMVDVLRLSTRSRYDPDFFAIMATPGTGRLTHSVYAISVSNFSELLRAADGLNPDIVIWQKRLQQQGSWIIQLSHNGTSSAGMADGIELVNETFVRQRNHPLAFPKGMSKAKKKQRKLEELLGSNVCHQSRFSWHVENSDSFVDMVAVTEAAVSSSIYEERCRRPPEASPHVADQWLTWIHYPWVRDNLYHLHNDNILPLLLGLHELGPVLHKSTTTSLCRRLLLLPSHRKQMPLDYSVNDAFELLFDEIWVLPKNSSTSERPVLKTRRLPSRRELFGDDTIPVCSNSNSYDVCSEGPVVFGRPPRPFSAEMHRVHSYVNYSTVHRWRLMAWRYSEYTLSKRGRASADVHKTISLFGNWDLSSPRDGWYHLFITWIVRKGERALESDMAVLVWIVEEASRRVNQSDIDTQIRVQVCCDGLSMAEQIALIRRTDILVGVHGAGLLHVIHLDPKPRQIGMQDGLPLIRTPLVVHIGSIRLNYHEQTIIERLALLNSHLGTNHRIRFLSTVTTPSPTRDAGVEWHGSFLLDHHAIRTVVDHSLDRYFSDGV